MSADGLKLTARLGKTTVNGTNIEICDGSVWIATAVVPRPYADIILALLNGETEKGDPDAT